MKLTEDAVVLSFARFLFQADVAHLVMLHSAAIKACGLVNGRQTLHPITFPWEVGAGRLTTGRLALDQDRQDGRGR